MPKITEPTISAKEILDALSASQPEIITVVCRKADIGNFENIDVGVAAKIPVAFREALTEENFEQLRQACAAAAEAGFQIASEETFDRYMTIKEMLASSKK